MPLHRPASVARRRAADVTLLASAALLGASLGAARPAAAQAAAPARATAAQIDQLRWLTGCWERTLSRGRRGVERWEAPRDGAMLGAAFAVTDSSVRENEQLRLFTVGDTLVYEAHPGNQARTAFRATRVSDNELVFENPAHDFPQRITYRRIGRDSLVARIEGDRAGRRAPVTFSFARAACGRVGPSAAGLVRAALQPRYEAMAAAERRDAGGRMQWVLAQAKPGYRYVVWAAQGSDVQAWDTAAVRLVSSQQAAVAKSVGATDRRYRASIERVRTFGDTADVLVESELAQRQPDPAGRYGPAGQPAERRVVQRWIDTWVRTGGAWRLAGTAALTEDAWIGGRQVVSNGRAIGG